MTMAKGEVEGLKKKHNEEAEMLKEQFNELEKVIQEREATITELNKELASIKQAQSSNQEELAH